MDRVYKCLPVKEFTSAGYKLVPLREEDKFHIMQWRNEQIDILRQPEPLTREMQEAYFKNVISKLFDQERPGQLLFSFLENDVLIGYGGLVHIDWASKNAEVSFLTATERNTSAETFISDWVNYLQLLKKVSSHYLNFIKVYTYAYDIRPNLYTALEKSGFQQKARLKNHVIIDDVAKDVLIHSFFCDYLQFRKPTESDCMVYYAWANDESVRKNSFNSKEIPLEDHIKWFNSKLTSAECELYLFSNLDNQPVGQIRIESCPDEVTIGISVDSKFRGKAYSSKMLRLATADYLLKYPKTEIAAYIKENNAASMKAFLQAGFEEKDSVLVNGIKSFKLIKEDKL